MNQPQPSRETIAERAYHLWEQAGKPSGRDEEFWLRAEAELSAPASAVGVPPVIAPPAALLPTPPVLPVHQVPPLIKATVKSPDLRPPPRRRPKRA
ncbi:MAG: DUF2934 domain-containing protein [Verrucomicrobia bacterium]|jgi:hypothetical protein|nr:DUF2934 domain-containing protein [Verrucomicrobiota bacterium]